MDLEKLPSRGQLVREQVRRKGLHEFLRRFWCVADRKCPGFIDNWHFGAKAEFLTAISRRQIKNGVINEPPGAGKTLTVDVLWQAWHWGPFGDPQHAWMSISFDHSLVLRNARQLIDVVTSPLFHEAWPEFDFGKSRQALSEFTNAHGGYRFSTSFDGKGTGRHVHTQICDDPLKPKNWNNEKAIADVNEKWDGTFSTRAIDRKNFARLIIMQRIAEHDPAGRMLEEQGYEHLCLPMRYEPNACWDRGNSIGVVDQRVEKGELLSPERFPEDEVVKLEKALGTPAQVEAQLQQNPTPAVGGVIEMGWLTKVWDAIPRAARLVQSWDFGFKGRKPGDPTAQELVQSGRSRVHGALYFEHRGEVGLVDEMDPEILSLPESKRAFLKQQEGLWAKARIILVEDKANGTGIIDDFEDAVRQAVRQNKKVDKKLQIAVQRIKPVNPTDDKLTRLIRHTDFIESGGLLVPDERQMRTVGAWKLEIVGFPKKKGDDRVDTLTQALDHLRSAESRYRDALGKL
jgi:hypothetical protein